MLLDVIRPPVQFTLSPCRCRLGHRDVQWGPGFAPAETIQPGPAESRLIEESMNIGPPHKAVWARGPIPWIRAHALRVGKAGVSSGYLRQAKCGLVIATSRFPHMNMVSPDLENG